jgi:hypothetical protein
MKLSNMGPAYAALTEALKVKRDSWMVLENLLTVCMAQGRLREAVMHMGRLLDLRHQSDRPVHVDQLRRLAGFVAQQTKKMVVEERLLRGEASDSEVLDSELPPLARDLEVLLLRITNTIRSSADVWDVLAGFHELLGRRRQALESRYKEVRALTVDARWAKELDGVEQVAAAASKLVDAHTADIAQRSDLYSCASLLKAVESQAAVIYSDSQACAKLRGLIQDIAGR